MGQNQAGIGGKETGIIFLPANEVLEYKGGLLNYHISVIFPGLFPDLTNVGPQIGDMLGKTCEMDVNKKGIISLIYTTRSGLAWLYIVDNWTNQINLYVIGALECITVGWLVFVLVFLSGFFVRLIVNHKKKNGFVENEVVWKDEN